MLTPLPWLVLIAAGIVQVAAPAWAPLAVALALATTGWPLGRAWQGARGTALRPAVCWAALAVGLGLVGQGLALAEPLTSGRPLAGHLVYVSVLSTLAALVSVLNARTPGGAAWAILMGLLVLVFLIPWLEGPGLARKAEGLGRLRLDAPWSLFYVLVAAAGVTNFLPTRYGLAAAWLGAGLLCEYLALTRSGIRMQAGARVWSVVPWTLAVAIWTAGRGARRGWRPQDRLDAAWLWFRDHWGVVWALRVQERFNRTAETLGWPIRLGWYGTMSAPGTAGGEVPDAAEATLRGLLRRFALPARIEEAVTAGGGDPCQPPEAG